MWDSLLHLRFSMFLFLCNRSRKRLVLRKMAYFQGFPAMLFLRGRTICSHIFMQICNRITFGLECCSTPRSSAGSLRPECECVVYIIFVEAGFFNLFWCKITGKLMHNGTDDFKVSQFFGAWIVIDIAPFEKEICFKLKL